MTCLAARFRQLRLARAIAESAHAGQSRRNGEPYYNHVDRVATRLGQRQIGVNAETVAYLHDVVEDTKVTIGCIDSLFPAEVTYAVWSLTRRHGESYPEFIRRIIRNGSVTALRVKLADLHDNMTDGGKGPAKKYVLADAAIRKELVRRGETPIMFDAPAGFGCPVKP